MRGHCGGLLLNFIFLLSFFQSPSSRVAILFEFHRPSPTGPTPWALFIQLADTLDLRTVTFGTNEDEQSRILFYPLITPRGLSLTTSFPMPTSSATLTTSSMSL